MALGVIINGFELVLDLMPAASTHAQALVGAPWRWSDLMLIDMGAGMALGVDVYYVHYLSLALVFHREGGTRVGHGSLTMALHGGSPTQYRRFILSLCAPTDRPHRLKRAMLVM